MTLLSLGAYGKAHGASRQAATKWRDRGVLVLDGDKVDVAKSDARMRDAGLGRFKDEAANAQPASATGTRRPQPARASGTRNPAPVAGNAEEHTYRAAVTLVATSRKASTSWLQRQLRIGYNEAARLIERMEADDLVSAPDHVGRREVLMGDDAEDMAAAVDEVVGELEAAAADGEIDPELYSGFVEDLLNGRFRSKADAAAIKENGLALKHLLAAQKAAGLLVELELAERVLFDDRRAARDAWDAWAGRFAPLIAADLGIDDGGRVAEVLKTYVHQQLEELGEPDVSFTGADEDRQA